MERTQRGGFAKRRSDKIRIRSAAMEKRMPRESALLDRKIELGLGAAFLRA